MPNNNEDQTKYYDFLKDLADPDKLYVQRVAILKKDHSLFDTIPYNFLMSFRGKKEELARFI